MLTVRAYLKLDEKFRESRMHLSHELLHEVRHLLVGDAAAAKTEIERIIKELLVVRAEVQADRNGRRRPDAVRVSFNK